MDHGQGVEIHQFGCVKSGVVISFVGLCRTNNDDRDCSFCWARWELQPCEEIILTKYLSIPNWTKIILKKKVHCACRIKHICKVHFAYIMDRTHLLQDKCVLIRYQSVFNQHIFRTIAVLDDLNKLNDFDHCCRPNIGPKHHKFDRTRHSPN